VTSTKPGDVLRELLDLCDAELEQLKARSVVGNAPLSTIPSFNM
jgi:hypothetical protein